MAITPTISDKDKDLVASLSLDKAKKMFEPIQAIVEDVDFPTHMEKAAPSLVGMYLELKSHIDKLSK